MSVDVRDIGNGVRMFVMNRPPANAISRDFLDSLYARCREAREDKSVRTVIVTGGGRFFSGGLDIKEAASGQSRVGDTLASAEDDGLFALWTLPKPTVAMVNGHTIAGGVIIALACDFRITASGNHRFGLNEVAIGFPFPIGAFEIARLNLGSRGLRYGLLQAGLCTPDRALELGMVDEVVEPTRLDARCIELANHLAGLGQLAYAHTKRAIQREAVARVLGQPPEERRAMGEIAQSEEARALLAAQAGAISSGRQGQR